eukprot:TRINITY_DN2558_c0_g1_i1.p1 TRINITY_DN2558_c0_g1~~TRINITY_DN2558_c0_g1_i1.p1  ORF type:complete len:280 (+),score=84.72 TRINITY_DN2558_c0_g1_i1:49-840(+)
MISSIARQTVSRLGIRAFSTASGAMPFAVSSTAINAAGMKTEVESGGHKFVVDEPEALGGSDLGANPLQYLLGGVSGCKTVVGRMPATTTTRKMISSIARQTVSRLGIRAFSTASGAMPFAVSSTAINAAGMKTEVESGGHKFVVDEPEALGGSDLGANPLQYLLGGVSGCKTVVGRIIAQEMDITIGELKVDVDGTIDLRGIMGDPTVPSHFNEINVKMVVETDADDAQFEAFTKAVASRCPVASLYEAAIGDAYTFTCVKA